MKLKDCRENYYYNSEQVSKIVRNLGFVGFAIIWIFKDIDQQNHYIFPKDLIVVSFILILTMTLDFFQYVAGTMVWGFYNRYEENKKLDERRNISAPKELNWPMIFLFWGKSVSIMFAYYFLIKYILNNIYYIK